MRYRQAHIHLGVFFFIFKYGYFIILFEKVVILKIQKNNIVIYKKSEKYSVEIKNE